MTMELSAANLSFAYGGNTPLWQDVSLSIRAGEIFSILGANGSGKSTLLRVLIGFLRPTAGSVVLTVDGDKTFDAFTDTKDFAREISYVPQIHDVSYSFTIRDYVVMGRAPHLGLVRQPGKEDYELTDSILGEMGIYTIRNRTLHTLSGGQQRQAAIARAVVQQPRLIVMDEPTNHLDYGNQYRMITMIKRLSAAGVSILLTTHMPNQAMMLGGRVGIVTKGSLLVGDADTVINDPILRDIYGMDVRIVYVPEAGRKLCIPQDMN